MPKEHLKDSNKLLYNKAKKELAADTARGIVDTALASWHLPSEREALKALNYIIIAMTKVSQKYIDSP